MSESKNPNCPKSKLLQKQTEPFQPEVDITPLQILERMNNTGFQAKSLGQALHVWQAMLREDATVLFGLAGAMVPAGMRKIVMTMIERGYIHCLVSTGANLFHDLHETLGRYHWQGSHSVDDIQLKDCGIDRIYDVFAVEEEFLKGDKFCSEFGKTLDNERTYTTREFFHLLGKHLLEVAPGRGIITSAYENNVPIYCPAIGDSSIGIGLALGHESHPIIFDVIEDVRETATIVGEAEKTGVIYVGGGTPKNFIQQTEVTAPYMGMESEGHEFALQITGDAPHWGGLSGCTFAEAQSWGKVALDAKMVTVYCDATIALPLLVSALMEAEESGK